MMFAIENWTFVFPRMSRGWPLTVLASVCEACFGRRKWSANSDEMIVIADPVSNKPCVSRPLTCGVNLVTASCYCFLVGRWPCFEMLSLRFTRYWKVRNGRT